MDATRVIGKRLPCDKDDTTATDRGGCYAGNTDRNTIPNAISCSTLVKYAGRYGLVRRSARGKTEKAKEIGSG
jgi:hypothetical protein